MITSTQVVHLENREQKGRRQFSPTTARNRGPISDALLAFIDRDAHILEIASGSGEHAVHMCAQRQDIKWQTSDINLSARHSQDDWRRDCPAQIAPSLPLDVTAPEWWGGLGMYDGVFCANMIHIAPWAACQGLAQGAGHIIKDDGKVYLYGPFLEGEMTAASNLQFDETLKNRNPEWGVRSLASVKHIFADFGFNLLARIEMPRENRLLVFSRTI